MQDLSRVGHQQRQLQQEDDELARAISLSFKVFTSFLCFHDLISLCLLVLVLSNINSVQTADEEKAIRMMKDHYEQMGTYDPVQGVQRTRNKHLFLVNKRCAELKAGNSSHRQLPVNHEPSHDSHNHLQLSKDSLNSNEWGNISSEDEAIMLETQVTLLFSQIPEGPSYRLSHRSHEQSGPGRSILQPVSRPQSSFLMDQRLLRQRQDEEYLTSLLADKEKEMNALKKAEIDKCSEDFDLLGLCCHIDEEHHLEAGYGLYELRLY
ncbi:hypothetical protein CRYUN_Cryun24cG0048800 [Craigia yunnanensis]